MEFTVVEDKNCYKILQIDEKYKIIGYFPDDGISPLIAEDYVEFLNDKYIDKEINEEWGVINRKERIKYHLEQLSKLTSDKELSWTEYGNGVK